MASMPSLILALRTLASDDTDAHLQTDETIGSNPSQPIDAANVNFRLGTIPVVPGSVFITVASWPGHNGFRVQDPALYELTDPENGLLTFQVTPPVGASLVCDYNYFYFKDAKYTEFLNQASENLQLAQSPADPTTVPTGLTPALMQYALANFFKARYAQYASKYSSSGGAAGQSVQSVGEGYLKAAKMAEDRGDKLRDGFYTKQSQSLAPAYGGTTTMGARIASAIDPITPRH